MQPSDWGEESFQMGPLGTAMNDRNLRLTDPIQSGDVALTHGLAQGSDLDYLRLSEFCAMRRLPALRNDQASIVGMLDVPLPRNPFEVVKSGIGFVAVDMVDLMAGRLRRHKGSRNQQVDRSVVFPPINAKLGASVSLTRSPVPEDLASVGIVGGLKPSSTAEVGNLVPTFKARCCSPLFRQHGRLAAHRGSTSVVSCPRRVMIARGFRRTRIIPSDQIWRAVSCHDR